MDVLSHIMYIGYTAGRDSAHEVFGGAVRIDDYWMSPSDTTTATVADIIKAGTHFFDAREIVRIPFAFAPTGQRFVLNMHWLEGLCAGLFHTYKHDAQTQNRPQVWAQKVLCPRLSQPRHPADLSMGLGFADTNLQVPQHEAVKAAFTRQSLLGIE